MFEPQQLHGFYGIVGPADGTVAGRVRLAEALVAGGACAVQLRLKRASGRELAESAQALAPVARGAGVPLVVNDRLDVALAVGADAVHLGQDDLSLADARVVAANAGLAIGVSTHNLEQVREAVAGGAAYLGYGPVYPTATKENPDPVQGIEALAAAVELAGATPVVAIGGITPAGAAACYRAGAAAVCAIGSVNDSADIPAAARDMAPQR